MKLPNKTIHKIITDSGYVDSQQLQAAANSAEELNKPLTEILVFKGLLTDEALGQLIADHFNVQYVTLKKKKIDPMLLSLISETTARTFRIIPINLNKNILGIGMEDPRNLEAIEFVKRKTGYKVDPVYVSSEELTKALGQYKQNIKKEFDKIIRQNAEMARINKNADFEKIAGDIPVIKVLDTLLDYGIAEGASDIHLELEDEKSIIRFRIDGLLRDILTLPRELHIALIARIKILSGLKIDEHRVPQDGRFKFNSDNQYISLRVSILPSFYGENTVMRILQESARPLSLEELGLMGNNLTLLKQNINRTNGMLLVTGPTGSGKTTTLYSLLNMLNTVHVKICTVEDPIEYSINRITQVQINPKTGLTFASGLRSLLRHDPNIIMVGEIRDDETVNMAIHSSLTGHLVLSTLHTNSASGAIPRFLDMGAEGFLVASTVNLIIAQRLVRRICGSCIEKTQISAEMIGFIQKLAGEDISKQDFYHGKGCSECGNTGYKGRVGIYEALEITPDIRKLIRVKTSVGDIEKAAKKNGMTTLFIDGLNKVGAGITTIEEVLRVVRE